jgi:hypothetical protein
MHKGVLLTWLYQPITPNPTTPIIYTTTKKVSPNIHNRTMTTSVTARAALDDLKDLLREGVITLSQWREEVAALVRLEREVRAPPATAEEKAAAPASTREEKAAPLSKRARKRLRQKANRRAAQQKAPAAPEPTAPPPRPERRPARITPERKRPPPTPPPRPERRPARPTPLTDEEIIQVFTEAGFFVKPNFYYAQFTIMRDQNNRPTEYQTIRGWAPLAPAIVNQMRQLYDGDYHSLGEFDGIAVAFAWGELYSNYQSGEAWVRIDAFEEVPEGSHEAGVYDITGVRLTKRGRVQPTLGCPAGRFVKAGTISRPEFYREDSCMLSLFLETWADRLVTYRDDLTLEGLYRMATGEELIDGQPAGVSIREAEAWLAHWRLACRVINARGELVWRYDPPTLNRKIVGGFVWRILVHDEHVWLCDRDTKEFDRAITAMPLRAASIPASANISAELSSRWRRPPKPSGVPPTFVSSVADILALGEDVTAVVTNGSPEALFIALWEAGYEPGSVRLDKGAVQSFTVRVGAEGKQSVQVRPAIESAAAADQVVSQALTSRSQVVFEEHLARARAAYQPVDGLSVYSTSLAAAFRVYSRGPRVGLLGEALPTATPCVEFDVSRAYTTFLAEIKQVPVFSQFDEVHPYDGADIEPLAFYLVRVSELDGVLFPQRCDFVPGLTVTYARGCGIALDLLGVARPCRKVATNGEAVLRALYDDAELPDQGRKDVANICYGLANKGRNRKQVAACYLDEAEAKADGGYLVKVGPGFIAVKQGEKALSEGYLPVGRLVLDAMRRRLHATVAALGGDAVAVKTDAVFVRAEHGERAAAALRRAGFSFAAGRAGWDVVGTMKQAAKPLPELKPLPRDESPAAVRPVPVPVCERIHLSDEEATARGDWSEVDALMPERAAPEPASGLKAADKYADSVEDLVNDMMADFAAAPPSTKRRTAIALEAEVPGAGKTYLAKKWLDRTGQKATGLIVCPWNALVTQLVREGYRAITLHELVGRLAVETEDGRDLKRAYNLTGVTHVHFEEAYLYPVHQVGWMASFMAKHPDLSYSMAGDPGQLAPVRQDLCVDSDAWYERAFATMFPRRICLRVSKRVTDPADRARMVRLCDELRAEVHPVPAILREAGLRVVRFEDLGEEDARYPHLAAMRSTMARVDHWAHSLIGETVADEYAVGQELLGVDGVRCRGGRIASNETYTVASVDDAGLKLTAPDGTLRVVTLGAAKRYLKRPYCRTGHSTQGLSLGDRIYIHDWRSWMATHRWVRTAVSRCGTLDIVLVDGA